MRNRVYVQVEVEVDDFLENCDTDEVLSWLGDNNGLDDYIHKDDMEGLEIVGVDIKDTSDDAAWKKAVLKIINRKMLLTPQQENTILEIADKLV